MKKLRTSDEIIVIAGKCKGERGKITKILPNGRLFVEGVNLVKKHVKPDPNKSQQGGIIEQEASFDASNVAIYNSSNDKADRVGVKRDDDGANVRYFKSNGELIDA
jgi:large subunit ribosomal protein L24